MKTPVKEATKPGKEAAKPADFLSVKDFSTKLGISKEMGWKIVWQRKIDIVRIGRRVLITPVSLEKYLAKHTIKAIQ
jgi:hypothetical protein